MSKWTQEQRDKACTYLSPRLEIGVSALSDHNLDAAIELACQRDELLEALKGLDAYMESAGIGYGPLRAAAREAIAKAEGK